jgi:hypothetical protein
MKNIKHHGRRIFSFILLLVISVILILWGWNNAIPDLFGLPPIKVNQALGLLVLGGVLTFILRTRSRVVQGSDSSACHRKSCEGK